MMILFPPNAVSMSQVSLGKRAVGVPCVKNRPSSLVRVGSWRHCSNTYPVVRIHSPRTAAHVRRNSATTGPKPYFDEVRCALHGVETSAGGIERGAITVGSRSFDTTPRVAISVDVAVQPCGSSEDPHLSCHHSYTRHDAEFTQFLREKKA